MTDVLIVVIYFFIFLVTYFRIYSFVCCYLLHLVCCHVSEKLFLPELLMMNNGPAARYTHTHTRAHTHTHRKEVRLIQV